jgi:hypothetical protein
LYKGEFTAGFDDVLTALDRMKSLGTEAVVEDHEGVLISRCRVFDFNNYRSNGYAAAELPDDDLC